jgi:hypothetical protein
MYNSTYWTGNLEMKSPHFDAFHKTKGCPSLRPSDALHWDQGMPFTETNDVASYVLFPLRRWDPRVISHDQTTFLNELKIDKIHLHGVALL